MELNGLDKCGIHNYTKMPTTIQFLILFSLIMSCYLCIALPLFILLCFSSCMICLVPFLQLKEAPFGGEAFCQVKLSTTCLTLKNQQIPIKCLWNLECDEHALTPTESSG